MEVNPSFSKMLQHPPAPAYQSRRPATSNRTNIQKKQRVNHISQGGEQARKNYASVASNAVSKIEDAIEEYDSDAIHFLEQTPCNPTSDGE